jgi:diguanylate cyclase (GGDEF)-like protein
MVLAHLWRRGQNIRHGWHQRMTSVTAAEPDLTQSGQTADSSPWIELDQLREERRLRALERFAVLDSAPEPEFDRIVRIASRVLQAPISLVSLIDAHRQWFKARVGLDVEETPRSMAFCAHAIQVSEVTVVPDALLDPRFVNNPLVTGSPDIRFYAGAPLITHDGVAVGTLCVIDRVPRELTDEQRETLVDLAAIVVDELELRLANDELSVLAHTDALTGALNRRTFFALAEREVARHVRHGSALSILVLDIDFFKHVNDEFGHETGDNVLVRIAGLIGGTVRAEDVFARIGGEEFVVLLPETDLTGAQDLAERIRARIAENVIATPGGQLTVTASIGVSDIGPDEDHVENALRRADAAMYRAKHAGRNQVACSPAGPP